MGGSVVSMGLLKRTINKTASHLPAKLVIQANYFLRFRRFAKILKPQRFTELVQHRKLFDHDIRFANLSDKLLAKDRVSSVLGSDWIIPTLWSGDRLPPRAERNWPFPYVLKANFGSSLNYFVRHPEDAAPEKIEELTEKWLRSAYAPYRKELYHDHIDRKLFVEPFIGRTDESLIDYKFYCFGGRIEFILVCIGRATGVYYVPFSPEWEKLDLRYNRKKLDQAVPPPSSLNEMMRTAEILSAEFDFVRIDFYQDQGRPKFSEFTFTPSSGYRRFRPDSYDKHLGSLWLNARARRLAALQTSEPASSPSA